LRGRDNLLNGRARLVGRLVHDTLDILLQTELGNREEMLNFFTSPNVSKRARRKRRRDRWSHVQCQARRDRRSSFLQWNLHPFFNMKYFFRLQMMIHLHPSWKYCKIALLLSRLPFGQRNESIAAGRLSTPNPKQSTGWLRLGTHFAVAGDAGSISSIYTASQHSVLDSGCFLLVSHPRAVTPNG
jgi:hypothetical protein